MENFYKLFGTLFGIGAGVAIAKWLKSWGSKSRKSVPEVLGEILMSGFVACIAALAYVVVGINIYVVIAGAILLAVLGDAFIVEHVEVVFQRILDKFIKKDE